MTPALSRDSARDRHVALTCTVAACVVMVALLVGRLHLGGWVVLELALGYPFLLAAVASALLSVAGWYGLCNSRVGAGGAAAVAVLGLLGAGGALYGWFVATTLSGGLHVVQSLTAPPPGSYRAVVLEGENAVDPYWVVQLRRGSGLSSQAWVVGCFDGDDPEQALAQTQWQDARHLVMITESGQSLTVPVKRPGPLSVSPVGTC